MTPDKTPQPGTPPHPERSMPVIEWPTLLLLLGTLALWAVALKLPAGFGALAVALLVPVLTLHSSLSHELLHGHPFRARAANTALGLFQPGLFVPYLRFRALHLEHHRDERLTDPYDDPESNFLDPVVWQSLPAWRRGLLRFNNTLLGRMVVGPLIGMVDFLRGDLHRLRAGQTHVALHWAAHLPGALATLWAVQLSALPLWLYLLACYGALSLLKVRTFLEHRAHERAAGRSVVIEDRGLLAFLFLNNNFHAVHHRHPKLAWYHLPALYHQQKAAVLAQNHDYYFRNYAAVFRAYLLRSKDPVAHPLWPGQGD